MQGDFIWYDLLTTDTAAAQRFYESVVGWSARDSGMPGPPYTLFATDGPPAAGMMALPAEMAAQGTPPCWTGYIAVDDVDAMARTIAERGGTVRRDPEDIPGIGRFAVVSDPQGPTFAIFQPNGTPPTPAHDAVGQVGWHELIAKDGAAAFDFYASLFGWVKGEAMDMGPMGIYQMFGKAGASSIGGMMSECAQMPGVHWTYYFTVASIEAAVARVKEGGGTVFNGPMQVPGGTWIAQCLDPQGAMFALNSMQK